MLGAALFDDVYRIKKQHNQEANETPTNSRKK